MFALSDAHEYSFSQVPYLKWEEKKTDLSNFVNDEMLFQSMFLPPAEKNREVIGNNDSNGLWKRYLKVNLHCFQLIPSHSDSQMLANFSGVEF